MDFDRGNGSSKYSKTDIEESDGSGSSKHLWRHLELDDEAGISEHSSEGSSGSSKHSRRHHGETGSSKHSDYTYSEVINVNGRTESNLFDINPEIIKLSLSSSSSSSSSVSSTDDQFQADIKLSKSRLGITSTSSFKLEESQNGSAGATSKSQLSSFMHESTLTQSPPIQVMDRLGEFDPYRIPSAVFARSKSTMDWSIASNESLFSIQVGNNSFSRDQVLNLKSGELFKSGEFIALSPSPVNKKRFEFDKSEGTVVSDDNVKDKTGTSSEELPIGEKPKHPIVSWNSSTISNHSDDTATSGHSFAFPVLEDGRNVSKNEKAEPQQQQQEQPLASAVPPSNSACCNCCSCFPSFRRRRRRRWHWHWCCSFNFCRGNCC